MNNNEENKKPEPFRTEPEAAEKIVRWLRERGGIALWKSIDLSNPGRTWTTPLKGTDGEPPLKPHWGAASEPYRIIIHPDEVLVDIPKEFKRFRVAIRPSSSGLAFKCTDASSRRIRKTCEKATGQYGTSWFTFDYFSQEAIVFVPDRTLPILEWETKNKPHSVTV